MAEKRVNRRSAEPQRRPGVQSGKSRTRRYIAAPERRGETILVGGVDNVILFTLLMLVIFGIVMIFSSSFYTAVRAGESPYEYLLKQGAAVLLGFVVLFITQGIHYERWNGIIIYIGYAVSNILLIYVKYFGMLMNGARRWIKIPVFGSFQPSELAKMMVIIVLANYIAKDRARVSTLKGLATCAAIAALPCILVFWGNNLSTALIIVAIAFVMVFVSSPHFMKMIGLAVTGVVGLVVALQSSDSFRGDRFAVWKNPFIDAQGTGYQTIQSLLAVASGGLFGLGLGQSRQKLFYMPEPFNDFIFAVICEELGFFGAVILLLMFIILIWRGILVALNAKDLYGTLLAMGIITMISVQVIINVAVVTNTIPNTGVPLPFISYGGTSVLVLMAMMGILLNISRYRKKTM